MDTYGMAVTRSLKAWEKTCLKYPTYTEQLTKSFQVKMAAFVPKEAVSILTGAIKTMCEATLAGSEFVGTVIISQGTLEERDQMARDLANRYRQLVTVSGFATGLGGLVTGMADFPLFLSMKMRYLHELAGIYGYDPALYSERLFLLHIFQLAFSSPLCKRQTFMKIQSWHTVSHSLVNGGEADWDWAVFQQEYRDAIDLAKLFQIVPGIGSVVGAAANHTLFNELATHAQHSFQLRWLMEMNK